MAVVSSYDAELAWLGSLPKGMFDIVIYQKHGRPVEFVTQHTSDLVYFQPLRNFGVDGGSREAGVYLQFLIDFYDNLPPAMVFSQDDCRGPRGLQDCEWVASRRARPRTEERGPTSNVQARTTLRYAVFCISTIDITTMVHVFAAFIFIFRISHRPVF